MKNYFTLFAFFFTNLFLNAQVTGTLSLGTSTSVCATGCNASTTSPFCTTCGANATGNCTEYELAITVSVPDGSTISITVTNAACGASGTFDSTDEIIFRANGLETIIAGNVAQTATRCYDNTSASPKDVVFGFRSNRRDEFANYSYLISSGTGTSCTVLAPLPVKFSALEVENKGKAINLAFSTLSEVNNDYFTIERSADGLTFDDIARIAGAGNSGEELSYQYADNSPVSGINYYRIRQTDYDGTFAYSEIVSATVGSRDAFTLTPRVTNDVLEIRSSDDNNTASVYTLTGNLVKTISFVGQTSTISIADLAAGMYIVRLSNTVDNQSFKIRKL